MKKTIVSPCIPVTQPIGTFYLGRVTAEQLRGNVVISRKSESKFGQQRDLDKTRAREISNYCSDPDATFPTSIILSVESSPNNVAYEINEHTITIHFDDTFGEVIDGQHRLFGILDSSMSSDLELPVVFMLDPTVEEKAYVFSIINSKQTKVSPSLIYDLFDVFEHRSPGKTVHELARSLNSRQDSPFYTRLKMLGKSQSSQSDATLSQGTFSKRVLMHITKDAASDTRKIKNGVELNRDKRLIFRDYFIDDRDDVILKVLINCFNALKEVFPHEWEFPKDYILWKSTGFNAVIDSMPEMYEYCAFKKSLKQTTFEEVFRIFAQELNEDGKKLTSEYFGSGESETKRLKDYIVKGIPKLMHDH